MPLSRHCIPRLRAQIDHLRRTLEIPATTIEESCELRAKILSDTESLLHSLMPSGVNDNTNCPDITDSDLDIPHRVALLDLRKKLVPHDGVLFASTMTNEPGERLAFRVYLESLLKSLITPPPDKDEIERIANAVQTLLVESDHFRFLLSSGLQTIEDSWRKRIETLKEKLSVPSEFCDSQTDPVENWFLARGFGSALEFIRSLPVPVPPPIFGQCMNTHHEAAIRIAQHNHLRAMSGGPNEPWRSPEEQIKSYASKDLVKEVENGVNNERKLAIARLAEAETKPDGTERGEGGKLKPNATTEAILPTLLSASDIANRIQKNPKSVTSFLSRFAEKNPDCRVQTESKRRNEPSYLYRTADVWPSLEKWMKDDAEN